ncbi:MAG TPA: 3-oxoacyl-ACP reductase FabG [Syntrophomonas sp.]|nr:3-oxoacyl-ACP reductase FabG [Syntrophomonas sp.]
MRLQDKVAVITGAGKGIGASIARRFSAEGACLAICDQSEELIATITSELTGSSAEVLGMRADVTDREALNELVKLTVERFGTIDILVNNAGIMKDVMMHKMSEADWDLVMNVNMKGMFNMTQPVAAIMREKGSGKIINISSASRFGNVGQTNYSSSKEAVVGFTRSLAKELGPKGINVNAVAPGTIITDMFLRTPEHIRDIMKIITPLGRPGQPEEVASLCLFLASDESSYITGQVIHCDGGIFMP